ncbi:unnamed protein product [Vitrella brassicaformis CCMP3155]|uniref:Uncharacterized protein n=3 Tax=Vitrella brassicaformis TaxID=1169539 RepID=A0A0G4FZM8_VITBC|nr:unnamed protein product [Vitrella brassicaformis CCMP3155]|eukprot:CEM20841.1 unnamed protein product [Vitrella brassicaformis CCMP3155]
MLWCVLAFGVQAARASDAGIQYSLFSDDRGSRTPRSGPPVTPGSVNYTVAFFEQRFDHFREDDNRTFMQRYVVCDDFYQPGGPIFFYTGNEGGVFSFWNSSGFVFEMAASKVLKMHPLLLYVEHRYYGESLPFGDASFDQERVYGLTVQQALADYAYLIQNFTASRSLPSSARVLAFGGSYGGMLASWIRFAYPHLFYAAYSASGPVRMFRAPDKNYTFYDQVIKDFVDASPDGVCAYRIKEAFDHLRRISGRDKLTKPFRLCSDEATTDASWSAFLRQLQFMLIIGVVNMAMLDFPQASSFEGSFPSWPVNHLCDKVAKREAGSRRDADKLKPLVDIVDIAYNYTGRMGPCLDVWRVRQCADRTGCGSGHGWDYQSCAQAWLPAHIRPDNPMLPHDVLFTDEEIYADCWSRFGVKPDLASIPTAYSVFEKGSSEGGSRILWTNGDLDPWTGGGVTPETARSESLDNPTYLISGAAHHLDLRGSTTEDPQSVIDARAKIASILHKWLIGGKREDKSPQSLPVDEDVQFAWETAYVRDRGERKGGSQLLIVS